jgi:hypothetical protein
MPSQSHSSYAPQMTNTLRNPLRILFLIFLLIIWTCNFPYQIISDFVGAHFPWPTDKSWSWVAFVVEGALIQIVVCLPFAFLVYKVFRNGAIAVGAALSAIFLIRTLFELLRQFNSFYGTSFALYLALCHSLILVGGIAGYRRYRKTVPI